MSRSAVTASRPRTTETLEQRRQRTARARQSLAARFPTAEDRRKHLSRAGQIGNARRLTLSGDDAARLQQAYALLRSIAKLNDLDLDQNHVSEASPSAESHSSVAPIDSPIETPSATQRGRTRAA